jgi:hypothetical protein
MAAEYIGAYRTLIVKNSIVIRLNIEDVVEITNEKITTMKAVLETIKNRTELIRSISDDLMPKVEVAITVMSESKKKLDDLISHTPRRLLDVMHSNNVIGDFGLLSQSELPKFIAFTTNARRSIEFIINLSTCIDLVYKAVECFRESRQPTEDELKTCANIFSLAHADLSNIIPPSFYDASDYNLDPIAP